MSTGELFKTKGVREGGSGSDPFVKIGPDPAKGQVTHALGKLRGIRESQKYPGQLLYDMVGKDGNRFTLVGFFAVDEKIKSTHVGDAFDITFDGMVTTKAKKTAKRVTVIRLPAKDIPPDWFVDTGSAPAATVANEDDLPF